MLHLIVSVAQSALIALFLYGSSCNSLLFQLPLAAFSPTVSIRQFHSQLPLNIHHIKSMHSPFRNSPRHFMSDVAKNGNQGPDGEDSDRSSFRVDIMSQLLNPNFSLAVGVIGLLLLLVNRISIPIEEVTGIQGRSDLISLIACSALLLNGLSEQDIAVRERDPVGLVGFALRAPILTPAIPVEPQSIKINEVYEWAIRAALTSTPAKTVHLIVNAKFVGRGGVISQLDTKSSDIDTSAMPILRKALVQKEEVYLPDLQVLPGKAEFLTLLPINAQSVFIIPFGDGPSALMIGTNQAKALKVADQQRLRSIASIINKKIRIVN